MEEIAEVKRGPGRPPKIASLDVIPDDGPAPVVAEKMFPVRLLKNYKPAGNYEIVGEMAPAPRPGLDFPGKIWAGTVVKLPAPEAVALMENIERTRERVLGDDGKPVVRPDGTYATREVARRMPLAERADALPI